MTPSIDSNRRNTTNLFNDEAYIASLLSDIEMIFKDLNEKSENKEIQLSKELFPEDYIYNFFYKRKYLYSNELSKLVFPPQNSYFDSFKNHNKLFSNEWKPEGVPDVAGRIVVSKRNFERKNEKFV